MRRVNPVRASRGISLVLVLVLLGAMAVGAAAVLRLSVGTHQVARSFRQQALALQAAEAVLRYCEGQLLLPEAQRAAGLQAADLLTTTADAPAWKEAARWQAGAQPALVAAPWLATAPGAPAPVCLVEQQMLGSGRVHVVTARAQGPDVRGDAASGTEPGSVAWLQAVLLVDGGMLRERVQRRLLQPPLR